MARQFSGQRLRETRKAAGISIARLAIGIDRSVYTIQEYERGRATPSVATLVAMADVLSQSVDDLLVEDETSGRAA